MQQRGHQVNAEFSFHPLTRHQAWLALSPTATDRSVLAHRAPPSARGSCPCPARARSVRKSLRAPFARAAGPAPSDSRECFPAGHDVRLRGTSQKFRPAQHRTGVNLLHRPVAVELRSAACGERYFHSKRRHAGRVQCQILARASEQVHGHIAAFRSNYRPPPSRSPFPAENPARPPATLPERALLERT